MSAARELVLDLMSRGLTRADIGRALGRDSSMIGQIASGKRGENYGRSMTGYLRELGEKLTEASDKAVKGAGLDPSTLHATHPPRRVDNRGRTVRTRAKVTHGGAHSGVSAVKKQATKSGARSLGKQMERAEDDGRRGAVTLTCGPHANISRSGGKAKGNRNGGESCVDVDLPDMTEVLDMIAEHEGNVTEALIEYLQDHDRAGEGLTTGDILGIEFRSWTE